MNKWIWIMIGVILLASSENAARVPYKEKQAQTHARAIEQRKLKERKYAERIVRNTQLQTNRKKYRRAQEAQAEVDRQEQAALHDAYRQEVSRFTQLTQELALPVYTERPLTDIIQEAQISLQKITLYNPKSSSIFQSQLERALRNGKHPMSPDGKKIYPNTQLIAQQSVQSLIDYTQHAQQLVEETASQAEETASNMQETLATYRAQIASLTQQLDESQRRLNEVDGKLAKINETIKRGEIEITQKEAEAVNLAQCIDTFTTASSKLSQDRISNAENLVRALEEKAHTAEQHTTILLLRLQEAEKALRSVENVIQSKKNQITNT